MQSACDCGMSSIPFDQRVVPWTSAGASGGLVQGVWLRPAVETRSGNKTMGAKGVMLHPPTLIWPWENHLERFCQESAASSSNSQAVGDAALIKNCIRLILDTALKPPSYSSYPHHHPVPPPLTTFSIPSCAGVLPATHTIQTSSECQLHSARPSTNPI
jgi:hypothetical protein